MNLSVKIRRSAAKYLASFVEFIYKIKIQRTSFKHPPVIILTPGKVASSSIYDTLKKRVNNPIYHVHLFTQSSIKESIQDNLNSGRKYAPLHLIISKLLKQKMVNYQAEVYIITVVREPISRAISSYFQNLTYYKHKIEDQNFEINTVRAKQWLSSNLDSNICKSLEKWFDKEINDNFGIDVFKEKFDNIKKYVISHNQKYHHLILKMEDIDEIFPIAIQEFLHLNEQIPLNKSNLSKNKYYADIYKGIKNSIKLPKKTIEEIVCTRYFQHFYKDQETEITKKWMQNK